MGIGLTKFCFWKLRYSWNGGSTDIRGVVTGVTSPGGGGVCTGVEEGRRAGDGGGDWVGIGVATTVTTGLAGTVVTGAAGAGDAGPVQPAPRIIPSNKKITRRFLFFISTRYHAGAINSVVTGESLPEELFSLPLMRTHPRSRSARNYLSEHPRAQNPEVPARNRRAG